MCRVNYLSKQTPKLTLLISVHDDADATDDAGDYNRVTGIAQLKTFSCVKNVNYSGTPLFFCDINISNWMIEIADFWMCYNWWLTNYQSRNARIPENGILSFPEFPDMQNNIIPNLWNFRNQEVWK